MEPRRLNVARLRVACSEGTYVRTLCSDLGAAIGVPAHMGALVREASGPFVLYEARTIDEIANAPENALIAPEHIIPFPTIVLDLRESADFRAGRVVPLPEGATGAARLRARRVAHARRRRRSARRDACAAQGLRVMKVRHDFTRDASRPLVLAIGFFDGFHRGHREIARQTLLMRKPGWRSGVLTFANHPAAHLRPGTEPPLICTTEERIALFASAGFDECFVVRFDENVATLSPEAFLEILTQRLGVAGVAVGSTFRFGHARAGDAALMAEYLARNRVAFVPVENVTDRGERISSTRIRALIAAGDLALADHLLGGTGYEIRGAVEIGAGRGHLLGFPTANVRVPPKLLPKDGVYSAIARFDGRDYAALVSIGQNPQFDGRTRTVEAWIRDFHYTIYGRELALRELRYVREQRLFAGVDELIEQMQRDRSAIGYPSYG